MHQWWIHVMWEVELARAMQDPSSFTLCLPGVSRSPVSPRVVALRSPLGLSINTFSRGIFSKPSPLLTVKPEYPVQTCSQRVNIWGCLHTLYKGYELKMGPLESQSGVGVFWFIPLLLAFLSSANLLYREDFPSLYIGLTWSKFLQGLALG